MNKIDTSPAALRELADSLDYLDGRETTRTIINTLRAVADELEFGAAPKVPEVDPWQPIHTAPVDEEVDLWADGQRYADCWASRITAGKWMTAGVGYWANGESMEVKNPTHWMRAPEGPKT
jgi:hypothetical protein